MTKVSKDRKYSISVAMATYNGEKYIKDQILSILENLKKQDQIIISDDNSSDNTRKIIKSFKDNRIILIDGPCKGVIKNFENAIKSCTGDFIFLSDQDDVWEANKVDEVLNCFSDDILCVVHDAVVMNSKLNEIIFDSYFKHRNTKAGIILNIIKPSYLGCCMAFKKNVKKYILPFPNCIEMHDRWIGSVCDMYGKVLFLNKQLIKYRRHDENVSSMKRNDIFTIIRNRLGLIVELRNRKKNIKL